MARVIAGKKIADAAIDNMTAQTMRARVTALGYDRYGIGYVGQYGVPDMYLDNKITDYEAFEGNT